MIQIPVEPAITEYLHAKAARARIPLSGSFELTPVCNMSCRMCYVRMTKEQQEAIRPLHTAAEWLRVGEIARNAGMLYLLLTGGEPFLHPEFREIMTGLHHMGLLISINSNATMIDEDTVAWLRQVPPMRVNVTLYGASNETYARLCGNPQGFTQATRGIRLLREAGISVKINCSVTPYNAADLEAIFDYVKREGLIIQATSYMFPPLRRDPSKIGQNDRFSPEEAAYYSAKIESLLNGEEAFLERMKEETFPLPNEPDESCGEGEGIRCRAGKCSFWITWDGRLMPCGMLPDGEEQNVFTDDFASAWKQAQQTADAIRLPAKCAVCSLRDSCRACAAMVMTETGRFDEVPDYRCRMAHAYPDACRQVEQEIRRKQRSSGAQPESEGMLEQEET